MHKGILMNKLFLATVFCLVSNVAYSMQPIKLDSISEQNLLAYAMKQSLRDGYWSESTTVTLESLCCVKKAGDQNGEKEYEARFFGRYQELGVVDDSVVWVSLCKPRSAFISATVLKNNGVTIPE
jgi:hypothetical protein